jgi:diacylglycerol kinase family enzyme
MKYGLIVNPIAGNTDKADLIELFMHTFNAGIHSTALFETQKDITYHEAPFAEKPDVIVVAGGDGTVNFAAHWALLWEIPLGILPVGSANGLAAELKIGQDADVIINKISMPEFKHIDVLRLNEQICLHLADFGFNAMIISGFANGNLRGQSGYALNLLKSYRDYKPSRYRIITPNSDFETEAFMVVIANGSSYGTQVTINPNGRLDDGLFEICILKDVDGLEGLDVLLSLLDQELDDINHLQVLQTNTAQIINLGGAPFQIDGEQIAAPFSLNVSIRPKALKVII